MMTCMYAQYVCMYPNCLGQWNFAKTLSNIQQFTMCLRFFLKDLLLRFIINPSSLDFHIYYIHFIITLQMKMWCSIFLLLFFTSTHSHIYMGAYIFGFLLLNECSSASSKAVVSCVTQRLDCLYSWIQSNYGYTCYIHFNNSQNNIKYRLFFTPGTSDACFHGTIW